VLSDYRFVPGPKIKDGVQLVTAIHEINLLQRMATMTADPQKAREKLPQPLQNLPVLCKPFRFRVEQVLRACCASPSCPPINWRNKLVDTPTPVNLFQTKSTIVSVRLTSFVVCGTVSPFRVAPARSTWLPFS
jgi:hypothetical protein